MNYSIPSSRRRCNTCKTATTSTSARFKARQRRSLGAGVASVATGAQQLRRWAALPPERIILAIEEISGLAQRFALEAEPGSERFSPEMRTYPDKGSIPYFSDDLFRRLVTGLYWHRPIGSFAFAFPARLDYPRLRVQPLDNFRCRIFGLFAVRDGR